MCHICVGSASVQCSQCSRVQRVEGKQTRVEDTVRTVGMEWHTQRHMQMLDNATRRCLQSICQSLCLCLCLSLNFGNYLRTSKHFIRLLAINLSSHPAGELSKCCGKKKKVKIVKAKEKGNILGAIKQQQAAASLTTLCAYFTAVYRLS